jgi:hypothetical protein
VRSLRLALLTSTAAVALLLAGCGPSCTSFEVGFTSGARGEATPRAAVDLWLNDPHSGARDREPDSWHETADPLRFTNGDQTVAVADLTAGPDTSGYLVEGCQ